MTHLKLISAPSDLARPMPPSSFRYESAVSFSERLISRDIRLQPVIQRIRNKNRNSKNPFFSNTLISNDIFRISNFGRYVADEQNIQSKLGDFVQYWFTKQYKFCPLCIENCYHSYWHQFSFLTICPIHEVNLTTRCPFCNAEVIDNIRAKIGYKLPFTCARCKLSLSGMAGLIPYSDNCELNDEYLLRKFEPLEDWVNKISNSVVLPHSEQPLSTFKGTKSGLTNTARFLEKLSASPIHCQQNECGTFFVRLAIDIRRAGSPRETFLLARRHFEKFIRCVDENVEMTVTNDVERQTVPCNQNPFSLHPFLQRYLLPRNQAGGELMLAIERYGCGGALVSFLTTCMLFMAFSIHRPTVLDSATNSKKFSSFNQFVESESGLFFTTTEFAWIAVPEFYKARLLVLSLQACFPEYIQVF